MRIYPRQDHDIIGSTDNMRTGYLEPSRDRVYYRDPDHPILYWRTETEHVDPSFYSQDSYYPNSPPREDPLGMMYRDTSRRGDGMIDVPYTSTHRATEAHMMRQINGTYAPPHPLGATLYPVQDRRDERAQQGSQQEYVLAHRFGASDREIHDRLVNYAENNNLQAPYGTFTAVRHNGTSETQGRFYGSG